MDQNGDTSANQGCAFVFSEENVKRLKEKYLEEMRRTADDDDRPDQTASSQENPIRSCMRIMFEAANERDAAKRAHLACDLSKFLTRPDGLVNLFLAMIDFDTSSQKVTTHNQRFLAVAKIIAHLPKICLPYVYYCDNITKQTRPLLVHQDTRYSSLASLILKSLLESPHVTKTNRKQVEEAILNHLLDPLHLPAADVSLHNAILAIHNLVQNHLPTSLFVDSFSNLFYAWITLFETPSSLKPYLKSILMIIIENLQPGPACCLLEQTIFHDRIRCDRYKLLTDDEQITLELADQPEARNFMEIKYATLELLEACDDELLILEFFFHYQSKMLTSDDSDLSSQCASLIEPLLEQTIEENPANKLDLLTSIMSNGQRALELISRTLLNYLECLRTNDNVPLKRIINPSLNNCLDILEVLLATLRGHASIEQVESKIVSTLREISSAIGEAKLATQETECDTRLRQNLDSLIKNLTSEHEDGFRVPKAAHVASREYDQTMLDLNDKLVPVRVHALVRLKNFLLANDKCAVSRIGQLYPMIECSLADQEPYVFLASINLLAEMVERRTEALLPRLLELFAKRELDLQQRINVGEVLVRLARRLNKMAPFYAQQILSTFMSTITSQPKEEELIRMSSLVNVGEICRNLADSLGNYIVDILHCIERVLELDNVQVKCAAVELLRSTLMGLDRLSVESIQRELRSIYRILKRLQHSTLDTKICLQVQLALEEMARLAKELLAGASDHDHSSLVKDIKVLTLLE